MNWIHEMLYKTLNVVGRAGMGGHGQAWARAEWLVSRATSHSAVPELWVNIEFDYANIPAPPSADPIPVLDDSNDEIDQMLIDSITTPSKNTSIGLSPLPPSSDRFCTPEESPSDHQESRDLLYPKHARAQEAGNWIRTLGLDEEVDAEKKTGET
ncbi:hypothetical protein C8J57DRAFT_1222966 [Mycena rebaudengoi]|nr:hypothetical protein C8J57DRAFT_1222966 [Mycena rebaudengoi]